MNHMTEIALMWLRMGIAPIPCHYKSKRPRVSWEHYQNTLPTEQQVLAWFAGEHNNLALVCGWQGLVVIDFDDFDAYDLWLGWYANTCPPTEPTIFDSTYRVVTGRGVHLYLMTDEPALTAHVPGIVDIKASGYVLAPPSIHPSGRHYRGNDLQVLRVPTLHGVVPDEWLTGSVGGVYGDVVPLADEAIDRIDQLSSGVVERLRRTWRIEDMVQSVPTHDGWWVGHCPFHDDKEPSFWIDTRRQVCGCYRGCTSKPMDVINLFGKMHGLSNGDAIQEMARR